MKNSFRLTLVLLTTVAILLSTPVLSRAAKEEKKVRAEDKPEGIPRWFEPTDEAAEHILRRMAQNNPERAEELEQLRKSNPEQFDEQLRAFMQEQSRKRLSQQREKGAMEKKQPAGRAPMRQRHKEFLDWLGENYPEEAEKLDELREDKPELYMRNLMLSSRKYRRIMEASEENPELANVLKKDLELKQRRNNLLRRIREIEDEERKNELVEKLHEVVSRRFDLIIKRKQIAYEQLREELEELRKRVKKGEAEIEQFSSDKEIKVKERIQELLNPTLNFNWH